VSGSAIWDQDISHTVFHPADETLKGNIMTRSVFSELLKHNRL